MKLNDPISFAAVFAGRLHKDQGLTYGELPYIEHLKAVYIVLLRYGVTDKAILTAAYLHDLVEDVFEEEQAAGFDLISMLFGSNVCRLVAAVTDEPGENRKERKAKTYPKIAQTPGATVIKLADRIANLEHAHAAKNVRMWTMYKKEEEAFRAGLYVPGEHVEMWMHLKNLLATPPELPLPAAPPSPET